MTDATVGTRESRTPAFHRLHVHERDVTASLRAGFHGLDDLLLWVLDASKYTLGYLDDDFGRRLLTDPYRVNKLTTGDTATEEDRAAEVVAQDIVEDDLAPAFNSARAFIRTKAQDHDEDIDASKQEHTALIPRVDVVAAAQRKAVECALDYDGVTNHTGPVDCRADVSDWVTQVGFATTGFVPDGVIDDVSSIGSRWRRQLVRSRGVMLRVLIARDLLPPMNMAINDAAKTGMEQNNRQNTSTTGGSIS